MKLFPSLMGAPLLYLKEIIPALDPFVDGYHIDLMDGHFVPTLFGGPTFVHAVAALTQRPLWIHVMTERPTELIHQCMTQKGPYIFTIHAETFTDWHVIKEAVAQQNNTVPPIGVALSPTTPVDTVSSYLKELHHLLLMSVPPGASGQSFLSSTWEKLKESQSLCVKTQSNCMLALDGGIQETHLDTLKKMQVHMVAAASALFPTEPYHAFLEGKITLDTLIAQYVTIAKRFKKVIDT